MFNAFGFVLVRKKREKKKRRSQNKFEQTTQPGARGRRLLRRARAHHVTSTSWSRDAPVSDCRAPSRSLHAPLPTGRPWAACATYLCSCMPSCLHPTFLRSRAVRRWFLFDGATRRCSLCAVTSLDSSFWSSQRRREWGDIVSWSSKTVWLCSREV